MSGELGIKDGLLILRKFKYKLEFALQFDAEPHIWINSTFDKY